MNVALALRQALRGTGCRPFANDAKVLAGASVRYPDVAVTCSPFGGADDIVPDPLLVIAVVSPSTEREDRGRKKFDYFAQYAVIEQDERRIDLYTRAGDRWTNEVVSGEANLKFTSIGVESSPRRSTRTHNSALFGNERASGMLRLREGPVVL
jgi:Uma2 family endonuclease